MTKKYGNNASAYWRTLIDYSITSSTNTSVTLKVVILLDITKTIPSNDKYTSSYDKITLTINGKTYSFTSGGTFALPKGEDLKYGEKTVTITKTKATQSIGITGKINHTKGASYYKGTSTASATISVAARPKYTLSFAKGTTDAVSNMPSSVAKYYDYTAYFPTQKPTRDGWAFAYWHWSSGWISDIKYAGNAYTANQTRQYEAVWTVKDPPTVENDPPVLSVNGTPQIGGTILRNFTDIEVDVDSITPYTGRTLNNVRLVIDTGEHKYYSNLITDVTGGTLTIPAVDPITGVPTFVKADDGSANLYIEATDNLGAYGKYDIIGEYVVTAPTWEKTFVVNKGDYFEPSSTPSKEWLLDNLKVGKNYDPDTQTWGAFDSVTPTGIEVIETDTTWGFKYTFSETYVSDPLLVQPDVMLKLEYKHYDIRLSPQRGAFYSTTRQLNYSNGIYNQEFISGVDTVQYSGLASRAWWCEYNNPLYFPDTNYLEAGSNDTAIMGLTKVGDYLGIIKQSKTTDTAIYLAYPTSFESDTTFAVKQGVQGVGALAKYSFNILGDESLFLSPNGVMAIVPSEDAEHKTQNRSYFVDGRLLKESGVDGAYSFVFDGMYYLTIGDGSVYVLDGNQRNSWGNDKTNLVYECYYLNNIPATCMFKMNGRLLFSNENDVCAFTTEYIDAYDMENGDLSVPVKAEWSTVLDDDNALHYYKTMQKKGNLISILPIENEMPYKEVTVDAETFNSDKELYWTFNGEKYIQCTEESVYDPEETYFIENRTKTKVYVRKDDKEPVEIQRSFNLQSEIPSEMFFKKKFKKYKRLQFIIKNEAEEDFGIDCIVKNYSVGNYAKR